MEVSITDWSSLGSMLWSYCFMESTIHIFLGSGIFYVFGFGRFIKDHLQIFAVPKVRQTMEY